MTNSSATQFDVFLSYRHNPKDRPYVRQLAEVLVELGLEVWFDEYQLPPGMPFVRGLERGISLSRSGLVLIGSDDLGPWQNEEIDALLRNATQQGTPLIPVYLQSAPPLVPLPVFLSIRIAIDLRCGYTRENLARMLWGITGQRHAPVQLPPAATRTDTRDYIADRGHYIHKIKARDKSGQWAYYFVLVEPHREESFLKSIERDGTMNLADYGRVVASCYGEAPTPEVRRFLKETYDFDV